MAQRRAETSRIHAKHRRSEEAKEIAAIAESLPLPTSVKDKLDKASILRLAITFIRLKQYVGEDKDFRAQMEQADTSMREGALMLESLGGFFMIISALEEILFVSDNINKHLGLNQTDVLGRSILDFIYEQDKDELKKQFQNRVKTRNIQGVGLGFQGAPQEMGIQVSVTSDNPSLSDFEPQRQFFLRMKCSYSKRTAREHHASSVDDYVMLQWTGYLHYTEILKPSFLAVVVRPLQPTPIMELKMDGNMFISRHSLDMCFMYCDPRLSTLLGYEPDEVVGKSLYTYHHPGDLQMCSDCHANLITAGTSISKYYRFLSKHNEWCWLQTRATIVYNTKKQPQYIVCMNYIVSEKEGKRYLQEHKTHIFGNKGSTVPSKRIRQEDAQNLPSEISGMNLEDDTRPSSGRAASHLPSRAISEPSGKSALRSQPPVDTTSTCHSNPPQLYAHPTQGQTTCGTHDAPFDGGPSMQRSSEVPSLSESQSILQLPVFYLPVEEDRQELTDLALGNMWLSVHSVMDPGTQHLSEISPPPLASELERLSFQHCYSLMQSTTKAALDVYGQPNQRIADAAETNPCSSDQAWETCEQVIDSQALHMFNMLKDSPAITVHRSQSSSTFSYSGQSGRTSSRSQVVDQSSSITSTPKPLASSPSSPRTSVDSPALRPPSSDVERTCDAKEDRDNLLVDLWQIHEVAEPAVMTPGRNGKRGLENASAHSVHVSPSLGFVPDAGPLMPEPSENAPCQLRDIELHPNRSVDSQLMPITQFSEPSIHITESDMMDISLLLEEYPELYQDSCSSSYVTAIESTSGSGRSGSVISTSNSASTCSSSSSAGKINVLQLGTLSESQLLQTAELTSGVLMANDPLLSSAQQFARNSDASLMSVSSFPSYIMDRQFPEVDSMMSISSNPQLMALHTVSSIQFEEEMEQLEQVYVPHQDHH